VPTTIDTLTRALARSVGQLNSVVVGDNGPRNLLAGLGWDMPPGTDDLGLASLDLESLLNALDEVDVAVAAGTGGLQLDAKYANLLIEVGKIFAAFDSVANGIAAVPDYLSKTNIQAELAERLLDYLVVESIASGSMVAVSLGSFLGLVEMRPLPPDPSIYQVAHVRRIVHWDRFPRVFGDVKQLLQDLYQWGLSNFDPNPVVLAIAAILQGFSAHVSVRALPRLAEHKLVGHDVPEADTDPATQLLMSFTRGVGFDPIDVGISLIALRASSPGGTDAGFALTPYAHGSTQLSIPLTESLTLSIDASLDIDTGIAFIARAGSGVQLKNNLMSASDVAAAAAGHILVSLELKKSGGGSTSVLSIADGIGVEASGLTLGGGADISGGVVGVIVRARLTGGHFRLDTSKTDSFLGTLIPLNVDLGFELGVGWSSAYGFFVEGNASPQIDLGVHQSIGPFQLDTLHVGLTLGKPDLPLEVSLTGKGSLGPLEVVVQRLGVTTDVKFQRGNLGPVDLSLGIKPPTGLGIRIDAGLVSGGGFLMFDPDHHRYAGVLDCTIVDLVQVKIIGVLDTVMPDGSIGFSFLLIITFQFPPIQLGFGFTLSGVGGIGGVNRSMSFDALRVGLRAHTLDSVLFPADPVGNAPRIISDIESYFPVASGRYVFGPMFQVSWGTPSLISLSIGIILEVPDPVRMAILGQIVSELPTEDFALIEIHIDVLGTVDFGQQQLAIDGEMYQSRLVVYSLSGGMALRLSWGSNPNFAYSVGGLNPRFQPPPGFPKLARMSVSIGFGDNPRLSSNSYLAITSNSVQFGANVELYAAAAGFSVHGYVGFDALFIFSPFSFAIDFSAGVDVQFEGVSLVSIHLDASLAGPRPWHIYGHASFSILFFDVSATLDLQWGDTTPVTLPSAPVLPDLTKALEDPRAWSTLMPDGAAQFISLAPRPKGDSALVVHPVGALQVKEKLVPLDLKITKYGNYAPADGDLFSIAAVTVDGQTQTVQSQSDYFAIGQFTNLTDADKVSAPSYQQFHSGVTIGSNAVQSGQEVVLDVKYEESYIDNDDEVSRFSRIYALPIDAHLAMCRKGAGFVNALAGNGIAKFTTPGSSSPVLVADTEYVIASTEDLSVRSDLTPQPVTQYEAATLLRSHLASNPAQQGAVQVLPAHEAAA
jgi:hypothetical protein